MLKIGSYIERIVAVLRRDGLRAATKNSLFRYTRRKEGRAAFVLGDGAYQRNGALNNPANDAKAVAGALEELGFSVTHAVDLDKDQTEKLFSEFEESLDEVGVALFYYSGHGVQVAGENYLIPIGAETAGADALGSLIGVRGLSKRIADKVDTRIVILDACRNNPFAGQLKESVNRAKGLPQLTPAEQVQAADGGLAEFDVGAGTFLAFAAAPGRVAYEGTGEISFFTDALLTHMRTYGLEINQLMNRARASVLEATHYKQTPWSNSSLSREFLFKPRTVLPILILACLGVISGLICDWVFGPSVFYVEGPLAEWLLEGRNSWTALVRTECGSPRPQINEYLSFIYVSPFEGIVFGAVIGTGIWLWGRGTWWAALVALIATTLAWQLAVSPSLLAYDAIKQLECATINQALDKETARTVADSLNPLLEYALFFQLYVSGAIGAAGTYLGCALITRAFWKVGMLALVIAAGVALVLPFHLVNIPFDPLALDEGRLTVLYLTWQPGVAACIGYALSRYVPTSEEVSQRAL